MIFFYSSSIPRSKTPFQEAIVFVVGGGNYIEYQNLMDYLKVSYLLLWCFQYTYYQNLINSCFPQMSFCPTFATGWDYNGQNSLSKMVTN